MSSAASTLLGDNDVVRAVIAAGDTRLIAARTTLSTNPAVNPFFVTHPGWNGQQWPGRMAHGLRTSAGQTFYGTSYAGQPWANGGGSLVKTPDYDQYSATAPYFGNSETGGFFKAPPDSDVNTQTGVFAGGGASTIPGDWDNGIGDMRDGPYINKADEGDNSTTPYYYIYSGMVVGQTFFSPNRMIPSPVMFGSLPSGVLGNKPWQTLLFRPGPSGHPGLGSPVNSPVGPPYTTPPDSLLLDLFTMPVVEPYAISEPLSTAGRVNMNYQIIPFSYITRNTGLQAVLKSTQVISVSTADGAKYKSHTNNASTSATQYRLSVNIPLTLSQFEARFTAKDIFRSATEICSLDLVPADYTGSTSNPGSASWRVGQDNYWATRPHTGDNSRERPYADVYPLLTTQSNTYTVHYRVQTLKKAQSPGYDATTWTEGTDLITGEYRGSQTIERYLNPNDPTIPDYVANPTVSPTTPLSQFYRFRVVSTKQFTP
jgi:uncharacterized protein (TIGR02600 family)